MRMFVFIMIMSFFVLIGCGDQSQKEEKDQQNLAENKQKPAQVQFKKSKAEDWHFVATESSLYLATNEAIYRKVLGQEWVRTAFTIRDDTKVVSMYAVKRSYDSPILEFNTAGWCIYVLMDSGNLWAFFEGEEMDGQKLVRVFMPE